VAKLAVLVTRVDNFERYGETDVTLTRAWLVQTSEGMDARLATLAAILPDLVGKMERMKADTLLALVQDLNVS
jgi:hypothetical protein